MNGLLLVMISRFGCSYCSPIGGSVLTIASNLVPLFGTKPASKLSTISGSRSLEANDNQRYE